MTNFPHVETILSYLNKNHPFMSAGFLKNIEEFGAVWQSELNELIDTLLLDISLNELIEGYVRFTTGIMMSQKRYEISGQYEHKSFEAVRLAVYDNPAYVLEDYMPGLLLSHFLWPHHYRLLNFFRQVVLSFLSVQKDINTFCEVGLGSGLYSSCTMTRLSQITGVGFDISETALEFGKLFIRRKQQEDRILFKLEDINEVRENPNFDFLICQEVLEHQEDPQAFVDSLAKIIRPKGFAYITAALTAGQVDHIYLFQAVKDVEVILENAKLVPIMMQMDGARSYNKISMRPRVAAFLCQRQV